MESAQEIRMLMDELECILESEELLEIEVELDEAKQDTPETPKEMAPKLTNKGVQNYARKDGQSYPEKKGFTA